MFARTATSSRAFGDDPDLDRSEAVRQPAEMSPHPQFGELVLLSRGLRLDLMRSVTV
jgi:hypothetical protein